MLPNTRPIMVLSTESTRPYRPAYDPFTYSFACVSRGEGMPRRAKRRIATVSRTPEASCVRLSRTNDLSPRNVWSVEYRSKSTRRPGLVPLREPRPRDRMPTLRTVWPFHVTSAG